MFAFDFVKRKHFPYPKMLLTIEQDSRVHNQDNWWNDGQQQHHSLVVKHKLWLIVSFILDFQLLRRLLPQCPKLKTSVLS